MSTVAKHSLHDLFCSRVKARRLELGLTQTDVAERMGVTQQSYAQIESGRRDPGLSLISRVAAALEIEPGELVSADVPAAH